MGNVEIELINTEVGESALDEATRSLRDDLERVYLCTVTQPTVTAPQNSKSHDPALIGQLLLATVGSGGVAVTVLTVMRDWLMRNRGFKLRLKRDGVEFELEGSDSRQLHDILAQAQPLLVGVRDDPDTATGR